MPGNSLNASWAASRRRRHSAVRSTASSHCWRGAARMALAAARMADREEVIPVSRAFWAALSRLRTSSMWGPMLPVLSGLAGLPLELRVPRRGHGRTTVGDSPHRQRPHLHPALGLVVLPLDEKGDVAREGDHSEHEQHEEEAERRKQTEDERAPGRPQE